MLNRIKFIIIKNKAKKEGFPIINISDGAIEKYLTNIRGNKDDSDILVSKKISRNFYSGQVIHKDNKYILSAYGCLYIYYDRLTHTIYDVLNHTGWRCNKHGRIDSVLKMELNKLYGIKEENNGL